jgi:hypothetical protein
VWDVGSMSLNNVRWVRLRFRCGPTQSPAKEYPLPVTNTWITPRINTSVSIDRPVHRLLSTVNRVPLGRPHACTEAGAKQATAMSQGKRERISMFHPAWFHLTGSHTRRRFSCVFLSASALDAVRLDRHLSAAGIRAYHASDAREAELLLAITSARILLIDIDRTFGPWTEILQNLDESHPNLPKVVLTARDEALWSPILPHFALAVVPKPLHLGGLLGALEYAHSVNRSLLTRTCVCEGDACADGSRSATATARCLACDPGAPVQQPGETRRCSGCLGARQDP